jgi:hypothetical protein
MGQTMRLSQTLLWINCVLFIAFGLAFALTPQWFATLFTGAAPTTSSAMIDMRAVYGGVALSLAFLFAQCARNDAYLKLGMQTMLAVMLGLASARSLGIVLDGEPNLMIWLLLASEVVMAALALFALKQLKS